MMLAPLDSRALSNVPQSSLLPLIINCTGGAGLSHSDTREPIEAVNRKHRPI